MSETFTASNGIKVWPTINTGLNGDVIDYKRSHVTQTKQDEFNALREFFQHERDQELGQWRWPENPDYVIIPRARGVRVVSETTGMSLDARRGQYRGGGATLFGAAAAYFDAHPERKPWEDAKPEDVWILTVNGDTGPFLAHEDALMGLVFTASNGTRVEANDGDQITDGRRIWPESS